MQKTEEASPFLLHLAVWQAVKGQSDGIYIGNWGGIMLQMFWRKQIERRTDGSKLKTRSFLAPSYLVHSFPVTRRRLPDLAGFTRNAQLPNAHGPNSHKTRCSKDCDFHSFFSSEVLSLSLPLSNSLHHHPFFGKKRWLAQLVIANLSILRSASLCAVTGLLSGFQSFGSFADLPQPINLTLDQWKWWICRSW